MGPEISLCGKSEYSSSQSAAPEAIVSQLAIYVYILSKDLNFRLPAASFVPRPYS